eukprot:scaffold41480_cov71-Phaeocystis_antarctica.AAC.2
MSYNTPFCKFTHSPVTGHCPLALRGPVHVASLSPCLLLCMPIALCTLRTRSKQNHELQHPDAAPDPDCHLPRHRARLRPAPARGRPAPVDGSYGHEHVLETVAGMTNPSSNPTVTL